MKGVDFETRYTKLNDRQRQAVDTIDGPLMVVAGPGTGKTELLSMRAANILKTTDTLPENILCLTFTESGAAAMRKRLSEIIGAEGYKVAIHTFHSFGAEIINQYGEYFYHGANFRPASDLSAYELLRDIFDSLEFSNPLAGKMNDEYTHLSDTLSTISELKRSGLTNEELLQLLDANENVLDNVEPLIASVFSDRISKKTADSLTPIAARLASLPVQDLPPGIPQLANVLALSLAHAVDDAQEQDSTKPITAWKNQHLEKDEEGNFVFKDRKRARKLRALSYIYYQYLMKMQEAELYDFDDMVLRVVHAMEVFPDLRYNLQERYLYVMVDEFQDTNLAQARILHNLTTTPSGDAPNVMVVGDDDQAIYSFQGAEVGNILNFRDKYEDLNIITLTDNYRSAGVILENARAVITQGSERLERYMESIDKTLTAHRTPKEADVTLSEFPRIEDERRGIVDAIKARIDKGPSAGSVAVIARRHHELIHLLPYFARAGVNVNYERRDNVLDSDIITQLVDLSAIVCHMSEGRIGDADALLPQLLAHPAWAYDAEAIWQLSLSAYKNHGGWLEEMAVNPTFKPLHGWLFELSRQVQAQPAERIIDQLVGTPSDDRASDAFYSPLFPYFFSDDRREADPDEYVIYLEALRTIRAKLREYRPEQALSLHDFIEFIELHHQLGSAITSVRIRAEGTTQAVNLMTAHKSKGLEFDHVFLIGAIDSSWGERVRGRSRLIGYPENLPIRPSGDSIDERLRLFFVGMTRAKNTLSISYSTKDDNGRDTLLASFLLDSVLTPNAMPQTDSPEVLIEQLQQEWYQPLLRLPNDSMKRVLAHRLEGYKLSATHLTSFLDIARGGPNYFLINNLLHFPLSKAVSAQYGSAIHTTLQRAHGHLSVSGNKKPIEDVLQDFEKTLSGYHLPEDEFQSYLSKGTASLEAFLAARYDTFKPEQKTELSLAGQQSMIGEAVLTGSLDLVDIDESAKSITVTDYKTGSPTGRWQGKTDWEKQKLHKYRQQLMFYKLLVEHARDYSGYTVERGVLQFVEPSPGGQIYQLDLSFTDDEMNEFAVLVENVYRMIVTMELPDISEYPQTYAGMLAFEEDVRNSKS